MMRRTVLPSPRDQKLQQCHIEMKRRGAGSIVIQRKKKEEETYDSFDRK